MVYTRRAPGASQGETRLAHVLDSRGESPPKVLSLVDYHGAFYFKLTKGQFMFSSKRRW